MEDNSAILLRQKSVKKSYGEYGSLEHSLFLFSEQLICLLCLWQIDREALGRDAKTVFRDKSGKRRNLAAEQEEEEKEAKRKAEEDQKYQEWGQG